MVDHWAIQVGEMWLEVAGLDDDGHIRPHLGSVGLSDGLSDIVAEYMIKPCTGCKAASGAVPSVVADLTFAGMCWWLFGFGVVMMFMGWIEGQNTKSTLYWELGVSLVLMMVCRAVMKMTDEQYRMVVCPAILGLVSLIVMVDAVYSAIFSTADWGSWLGLAVIGILMLGSWAVKKMTHEQYGMVVLSAIFDVWGLNILGNGLYSTIVCVAEPGAWPELGDIAVLVILFFGSIIFGYSCWQRLDNWWCGAYGDPRGFAILGTTRKTDQQIEAFNREFERANPQYRGLSINCQWYAKRFLAFLMEEGERKRDLPLPESPLTNLMVAGLSVVLIFILMSLVVITDVSPL